MGLFGTLLNLGKAKMGEAEEKIEDKNRIAFAKQDIEKAEEELRQARVGLAQTKAAVMGNQRKIKAKEEEIADRTEKAKKLKAANNMELAKKQWSIKCELDQELETLQKSLAQYEGIYKKQESNVAKMSDNLSNMKRFLDRMKTMEEVKKSNNAIAEINTDSSQSAVAKFKEREAKMQAELDASTALAEGASDPAGDLDAETAKALEGDLFDKKGFEDL
jgi:phage shock protein A